MRWARWTPPNAPRPRRAACASRNWTPPSPLGRRGLLRFSKPRRSGRRRPACSRASRRGSTAPASSSNCGPACAAGAPPPPAPARWRRRTPPHHFVAILQKSPDAPAFAMTVDIDKLQFSVRPVAAQAPPGKSYELWIIGPKQAPKSLGVIDAATGERDLAGDKAIVRDAMYAVTVEPKGGSPTGKPSSAPVFFGKLVAVGP